MENGSVRPASVVVVGSINHDHVVTVPHRPAPGETVAATRSVHLPGGKGANQAVAAARLGASAVLVGRVGDDAIGRDLVNALLAAGVGVEGVRRTAAKATGTAFVTVTPDGENSIVVTSGANASLTGDDLWSRRNVLLTAGVLLLQLEIPEGAVDAAVELVSPATLVVVNAAPFRAVRPTVLERVDVLVVNEVEARQLVGDEALDDPGAFVGLGPRATVVTLGAAGARAFVGGVSMSADPAPAAVVDTTGAGDAFVGALGAWLANEGTGHGDDLVAPLRRALPAAVVAAGYSVGRRGAQPSYGTRAQVGVPW